MSVQETTPTRPLAIRLDGWLAELGIEPVDRVVREGVVSWDLLLDGRRRHDIRVTLILDPGLALVCWVHYAPPLRDSFRKTYQRLLHLNDELPFIKFGLSSEEGLAMTTELPADRLDRDLVGLTIARLVAVCDLLLDESLTWLWPGAKTAPVPERPSRHAVLLERYAAELGELGVRESPPDREVPG